MNPKKHLSFGSLRNGLSSLFRQLPDNREDGKVRYSIHDTMMFGFACMYFQDPSLSQFQGRLKEDKHKENLKIHFDIKDSPKSTQMKTIIDNVSSEEFRPIFKDYFSRLQRGKHLEQYQIFDGLYLCSIDATQYFHSKNIDCPNCLTTEHKNGISYAHKVLQAAIMHPDMHQVIPLMPEEIINTDGSTKQDCETNAAKRLIPKIRQEHPQLGIIVVGDGLFSKQPMIEQVFSERMHYIFVAKPSDHIYMMRWIEENKDKINKICIMQEEEGLIHLYEWINDVPLNGRKDSINVNFFRYQLISIDENNKEKVIYQNSWITDLQINTGNVKTLVRGGRCRWKIENECFNTFKNQGYNIEHNYGHGQNNLCFNFFLFTLLAFYFHQIFELTDDLYKGCRQKFGSKMHMWETIRSYIKILLFETWEHLLDFALTPQKYHLSFKPLSFKPP